ncbi:MULTISPECIES: hypothetical protein [unclassified Rhizobium]|uniref:hypothetical protein n=1 Tax=unclassified Rhizobium TaxID=2613769 RepID=UPI001AD9A3F8|nr:MULTISPECIES: hypothetical protein [unclassified Rhizobium]MBO9124924.1 hypothetical protein [Rhizobium sp. 16-488-2b]MBO9175509.1 hypothetical protein [Rhizobium sp. 16-488-2a]
MRDALVQFIADSFIASAERDGFNGTPASLLLEAVQDEQALRDALGDIVGSGQITAVFSSQAENMHIKRFPDRPVVEQLQMLKTEPLAGTCLYPTADVVKSRTDVSLWQDRPFTQDLLLAAPQLGYRAFELGVLERYVNDPRYVIHFADYMGRMSIGEEAHADNHHPDRDKIYLKSFGLGFAPDRRPFVVAFLRYLATLTPQHQQYWNSYTADGDIRMSEPYFRSSIEGNFWSNRSIRNAIVEEMRLIRELSKAIWGSSLFRDLPVGDVPIDLTSFLRPTRENFNRFVMALDKMLSDSIDVRFFEGKVALERETERRDGKVVVSRKGTLTLLEEWLGTEVSWWDPQAFREVVIEPLREVRRLRQKPAHGFSKDTYSSEFDEKRKKLLWAVFNSLSNIRATFSRHSDAVAVQIPAWLDGDGIDVF